jgi:hypothetical protein
MQGVISQKIKRLNTFIAYTEENIGNAFIDFRCATV